MVTVILTHRTRDFDTWKQAFTQGRAKREQYDIRIQGVYRSLQDPNMVTIVSQIASPDVLQRFMADPEQQALMQQAGVEGAPTVQMLEGVAVAEAVSA